MTHNRQDINLETLPDGNYNLSYTCFLLPRNPQQNLTGSLSNQLDDWLQAICKTHGWKLEFVVIHPHYLQWALSVSPAVATFQIIQQVRTQTSQRIEAFMGKTTLPDFWAPGYLTLQGLHQNADPILERYMKLIRM